MKRLKARLRAIIIYPFRDGTYHKQWDNYLLFLIKNDKDPTIVGKSFIRFSDASEVRVNFIHAWGLRVDRGILSVPQITCSFQTLVELYLLYDKLVAQKKERLASLQEEKYSKLRQNFKENFLDGEPNKP